MIDGKAISRKHVTLSVSPVKAGNGVSLWHPGSLRIVVNHRSLHFTLARRLQSKMRTLSLVQKWMASRSRLGLRSSSRMTSTHSGWGRRTLTSGKRLLTAGGLSKAYDSGTASSGNQWS